MLGLIEESGKVVKDVKNIEKSVTEFKLLFVTKLTIGVIRSAR